MLRNPTSPRRPLSCYFEHAFGPVGRQRRGAHVDQLAESGLVVDRVPHPPMIPTSSALASDVARLRRLDPSSSSSRSKSVVMLALMEVTFCTHSTPHPVHDIARHTCLDRGCHYGCHGDWCLGIEVQGHAPETEIEYLTQ